MPLYDVSYQRFDGTRRSRLHRIWALSRAEILSLSRRRLFLLLVAVSWIPAIVRGGQIYVDRQFPDALSFFEVTPSLWREFLSQQVSFLFVILVAVYAGSGAIANDLGSGALLVYLSKPISRMDYLVARTLPVLTALLAISLLPALALILLQILISDGAGMLRQAPWLLGSIATYSLWMSTYFTLLVLAISSLTRSRRLAAAGVVLLALGSHVLYGTASRMTFGEAPSFLSVIGAAVDSARFFFGEPSSRSGSPFGCVVSMGVLMGASILVIHSRLRSTEVTS